MKRALLCLSALAGLCLGCCTQPREIRAAATAAVTESARKVSQPSYRIAVEWVLGAAAAVSDAPRGTGAKGF
jgi:hypothetical protein